MGALMRSVDEGHSLERVEIFPSGRDPEGSARSRGPYELLSLLERCSPLPFGVSCAREARFGLSEASGPARLDHASNTTTGYRTPGELSACAGMAW